MKDLKLKIELVPKTAHFANLRNALKKSRWQKIAKETKERQVISAVSAAIKGTVCIVMKYGNMTMATSFTHW